MKLAAIAERMLPKLVKRQVLYSPKRNKGKKY